MDLVDYTIPTILRVAKGSDSSRMNKRTSYSSYRLVGVDTNELRRSGDLVLQFEVKSPEDSYKVSLKLLGYQLYYDIYYQNTNNIYSAINKALEWSLKNADIKVNCTCPDFKYRFAYVATQHDYKYGDPETRPAKVRNPNNKGRVCKHILAVLMRPSNYTRKLESILYKFYN